MLQSSIESAAPTLGLESDVDLSLSNKLASRALLRQKLRQQLHKQPEIVSSGYSTLDDKLPNGGWPLGSLIEVLCTNSGHGELQLFMPALAELNQQRRHIAWLQPPHIPYLPGLIQHNLSPQQQLLLLPKTNEDGLWTMEQLSRSSQCGAVLAWLEPKGKHCLRRLQLAAEHGNNLAVLYRPISALNQPSTAAIRLSLKIENQQLHIQLHKVRGGKPAAVTLSLAELAAGSSQVLS